MDETNLTPRQRYLLNLVNQLGEVGREELQTKTAGVYPVSKPTLIRDLNTLVRHGLVRVEGKAKATKYLALSANPLLRQFDSQRYFADDPDKRVGAKKTFDFSVFDWLHDLFLSAEQTDLDKVSRSFVRETKRLGGDVLKRELERFVIELAWKSSKIEGNTYTLLETESLLKDSREAAGRSKQEAIMILNHKAAFEQILATKERFRRISISGVNQLHNVLVKGLGITAGIRKQAVGITGTVYRPLDNQHQIGEALERMIDAVNRTPSVYEKALIAHFMIPYIQPYLDGNKRTARMLTNALLLAHDLFPLSYRSVDEDEFKKALILFYEQNSIVYIKKLFIDQVVFANENYFK